MTQFVDFVALGWVEKNLREEMEAAKKCLHLYQREPDEPQHLREAQRNIHSATGALRLCALDPAALLTEEVERVLGQLHKGMIVGEARKLAMTELVAAIEALPAYLASVRAKREVTAGSIASMVNDLRHFGNRPPLPESLFFNPPIPEGAGISKGKSPIDETHLKEFAGRAMQICHKYSRPALERDHQALKRLYAVGKHAHPMLAGSPMEAYFRCYMGLIEVLAQSHTRPDEVIVDILKHCFGFLRALAAEGVSVLDTCNPAPYIKKMLYYIGKTPTPSALQKSLREIFDIHSVDDFTAPDEGRLIQEDDLLDALGQTLQELMDVMEFMTSRDQVISSENATLVETIVPKLKQISLQLNVIGLSEQAEVMSEQHAILQKYSEQSEATPQSDLVDFGGALIAVKEAMEYKLKHGLSAHGDGAEQDLDSAIAEQVVRCLGDMKDSINREFARQDLEKFTKQPPAALSVSGLRPLFRAAKLVAEPELLESIQEWGEDSFPELDVLNELAKDLLTRLQEAGFVQRAVTDLDQVLSVLALLEDKNRECEVLKKCAHYVNVSVELGGLVNDSSMACFAEAIAALEQFMECRTEDPLGNSDEHLDRAEARAAMLEVFLSQRSNRVNPVGNIVEFGPQVADDKACSRDAAESASIVDFTPAIEAEKQPPEELAAEAEQEEAPVAEEVPAEEEEPVEELAATEIVEQEEAPAPSIGEDKADTPEDNFALPGETTEPVEIIETAAVETAAVETAEIVVQESAETETPEESLLDEVVADTIEVAAIEEPCVEESEAAARKAGSVLPWRDALDSWVANELDRGPDAPLEDPDVCIDEELVECFVEESRKHIRKLEDAVPRFGAELHNEKTIQEIRAVFHTMKGSARTIELNEFGEFMYDMEKIFNALRDGYIQGSAEIAEFVAGVSAQLTPYLDLIMQRVPLYSRDFCIPAAIAAAISEKRFSADAELEILSSDGELQSAELLEAAAEAEEIAVADEVVETAAETLEVETEEAELELADAMELVEEPESVQIEEVAEEPLIEETLVEESLVEETPVEETLAEEPVIEEEAAEEAAVEVSVIAYSAEIWEQHGAGEIMDSVAAMLAAVGDHGDSNTQDLAQNLVRSVVPALVELRDGDFLELGAHNLGYFLELPVLEHLASDAVFGLVDAGDGEYSKVPISNDATNQLRSYLEQVQREQDSPAHAEAEALVRSALSLPEPEPEPAPEAVAEESSPAEQQAEEDNVVTLHEPFVAESAAEEYLVEDIDTELLELFIETIDEYTDSIDEYVAELAEGNATALRGLKNTLHTVKGAANSIGLRKLGALVHDFESCLGDLEHTGDVCSRESVGQIDTLVEGFSDAARFVRVNNADWDPDAVPEVVDGETAAAQFEAAQAARMDAAEQSKEALPEPLLPATEEGDASDKRADTLRIETHRVDRLLDIGLEISMSNVRCRHALDAASQDRTEVQGLARRVLTLVDKLSLQLDTEIQARTEVMPEGGQFDPLEMDRMTEKQSLAAILREAAYDLQEEAGELGLHLDSAMREAISSSRLLQSNQSDLRLLRLVNFSKLGPGFRRLVHQVSRQLGKQVEFDFTCGEGGLDISVFEKLKVALEHMLRNAIDHGVGTPEERSAQGKAESGNIKLIIMRQGSEFVIRLLDDGNGMDPEVLRKKALEKGIISEADKLTDDEALRLVFHAGLSTASTVTDVSGRGVGMDVVFQSVTQVGGTVEIQSKQGFYTQFDIRVPASIMVNGALVATIGEEQVAVPLTSLVGSDFRRRDDVHREASVKDGRITFRDEEYQLRYLGTVRGSLPVPSLDMLPEFVPVLFAELNRRRVAFFVDALDNAEEMVIRSLGAQFTGVPGIAGGAVKSDGQPVLALDLNEFIGQVDHADEVASVVQATHENSTLILCVDDSVMMRRTYEKRLQSLGYKVVTAVDGEDAIDYLSQAAQLPDFIFTDLEMPNMNGFDFIANLRRMPNFEHIPTVVVSSRDAEKHRSEAQRVGATDFMAKGANSADGMQAVIQRHLSTEAMAS